MERTPQLCTQCCIANLRDDGEPGAKGLEANPAEIHPVQEDGPLLPHLDEPEEEEGEAGLARPRPPADPDLLAVAHGQVQMTQHRGQAGPVHSF